MKTLRKIGLKLAMFDALWSFPLTMVAFVALGALLQHFDLAAGAYDIAFFQPLLIAVGVVVGAANAAVLGKWFNFRGLFRFMYGTEKRGQYSNPSKEEWKNLTSWQKFALSLAVYFLYFFAVIMVYLNLV